LKNPHGSAETKGPLRVRPADQPRKDLPGGRTEHAVCADKLTPAKIPDQMGEAAPNARKTAPLLAGGNPAARRPAGWRKAGFCHVDFFIPFDTITAGFMRDGSTSYPVRFGHEFVGRVTQVGEQVKSFRPGDRVISEGFVSCGRCEECRKGNFRRCRNLMSVGTIHTWPGSYAEYVLFPERHLLKVPDSICDDAAALIEPAAVGMDGVQKANIRPGESVVLVTGSGTIGIAAAALAKHYGAKKVLVSGRTSGKLEVARRMGADAACNSREESLSEFVRRETDGHGVDSLIECSGNIRVLDDCVDVLAEGGTLAVVAFYEELYTTFDIDKFVMKNCRLESVMDHAYQEVLRAMLDGVDLTPLITRHIPFSECGSFMTEHLREKSRSDIKVMVDFP